MLESLPTTNSTIVPIIQNKISRKARVNAGLAPPNPITCINIKCDQNEKKPYSTYNKMKPVDKGYAVLTDSNSELINKS